MRHWSYWNIGTAIAAVLCLLVAFALVAFGIMICLLMHPVRAHDGYPIECCSDRDCRPAKPGEVKRTPQGWRLPSGHVLAFDDARIRKPMSHKPGVHICEAQDATRRPICLFIGEDQL